MHGHVMMSNCNVNDNLWSDDNLGLGGPVESSYQNFRPGFKSRPECTLEFLFNLENSCLIIIMNVIIVNYKLWPEFCGEFEGCWWSTLKTWTHVSLKVISMELFRAVLRQQYHMNCKVSYRLWRPEFNWSLYPWVTVGLTHGPIDNTWQLSPLRH